MDVSGIQGRAPGQEGQASKAKPSEVKSFQETATNTRFHSLTYSSAKQSSDACLNTEKAQNI